MLTGRQCHGLSEWQLEEPACAPAQVEAKQNAAKQAEAAALQERIALQKAHAAELAERLEAINEISRQRTELQVWQPLIIPLIIRDMIHSMQTQCICVLPCCMY